MCREFTKAGQPDYVRACYRTGQPGVHIPVAEARWKAGHHHLDLGATGRVVATGHAVYFQVPPGTEATVALAEMARYADATPGGPVTLGDTVYVALFGRAITRPNVIERGWSFGWIQVSWQPGLPEPPARPARKGAPRPPRRRPVESVVSVVTPAATPLDTLAAFAATLTPPADWLHTDIPAFTRRPGDREHPAVRLLTLHASQGWTRTEVRAVWAAVEARGGRPWTRADVPPPPPAPPAVDRAGTTAEWLAHVRAELDRLGETAAEAAT